MARTIQMVTKKSKKAISGFTLVEISVVLLIIGIIVLMAVKSYNVITSARLRTELAKINTIETGVASFKNIYGYLPGEQLGEFNQGYRGVITTYTSGNKIYDELMSSGLVNKEDFTIYDLRKRQVGSWVFWRCPPMENDLTYFGGIIVKRYIVLEHSNIHSDYPHQGVVCISGDTSLTLADNGKLDNKNALTWAIVSGYELFMDDASDSNGKGSVNLHSSTNSVYNRANFETKLHSNDVFVNGNSTLYIKIW